MWISVGPDWCPAPYDYTSQSILALASVQHSERLGLGDTVTIHHETTDDIAEGVLGFDGFGFLKLRGKGQGERMTEHAVPCGIGVGHALDVVGLVNGEPVHFAPDTIADRRGTFTGHGHVFQIRPDEQVREHRRQNHPAFAVIRDILLIEDRGALGDFVHDAVLGERNLGSGGTQVVSRGGRARRSSHVRGMGGGVDSLKNGLVNGLGKLLASGLGPCGEHVKVGLNLVNIFD